jgi:hypothetical protein
VAEMVVAVELVVVKHACSAAEHRASEEWWAVETGERGAQPGPGVALPWAGPEVAGAGAAKSAVQIDLEHPDSEIEYEAPADDAAQASVEPGMKGVAAPAGSPQVHFARFEHAS